MKYLFVDSKFFLCLLCCKGMLDVCCLVMILNIVFRFFCGLVVFFWIGLLKDSVDLDFNKGFCYVLFFFDFFKFLVGLIFICLLFWLLFEFL